MRPVPTVSALARHVIKDASQKLGVADPLRDVGGFIDGTLSFPLGEQRRDPLSPTFSETTPEHLGFVMAADGPGITAADRVETATRTMQDIVDRNFGRQARHWLDARVEAAANGHTGRRQGYGATLGSSYDRNGITESFVQYEWGPNVMDSMPGPLFSVVRVAMEALPGLRPTLSTVRCGRTSGSQQVSFEVDRALPLNALQPLMERLGLGARNGSLMSAVAFVLGARFTLPPETAMITLRPTRAGVEMRLDVNLDALPDPPAQLMALMRLQMTDRPRSLQGFDRWLMALTPDGHPGPGTVSVLSAWVRPDSPARLAIFLRPALFDTARAEPAPDAGAPRAAALEPTPAEPEWAPLS